MNRKYFILTAILILILIVVVGSYYISSKKSTIQGTNTAKITKKSDKSGPELNVSSLDSSQAEQKAPMLASNEMTPETIGTSGTTIQTETSYDINASTSRTLYRNIGARDLFTPLIPPPPPPKPRERGVNELTINWILEEIVNPTRVIITDTRRTLHEVTIGDDIDGIKIGSIEPNANRVELVYKDESKWLVLQDIETVTRGWKLEGVSPDTKEAYIFVERAGGSRTLSEGTTFEHVRLEKVNDDGVILEYGTQSKELKAGG